jgi:hypothetical protein
MSETNHSDSKSAANTFRAESQSERRVKYGSAVALTIVIAVALLTGVLYLANDLRFRTDTTSNGIYSLKPQTVNLIQNLPQKVKIVGLFSKARQEQEKKVSDDTPEIRFQQVSDLLQEYQQKSGGKITAEMIDTVNQPGKVDQLFNEVAKKYGNDINKYQEIIDAYPKTLDQIRAMTKNETDTLKKLPKASDPKLARLLDEAGRTLDRFPTLLDQIASDAKDELQNKVPDYKRLIDNIRGSLEGLDKLMDALVTRYKAAADEKDTPKDLKDYFTAAQPRIEAMKKPGTDLLKKAENLGSIKQLDELRENKSNSIAVMGEKDIKVLPISAIYKVDNARVMDADPSKIKPRFAGEQQISTAIYTLTAKEKKKIVFVRSGGEPVTSLPMFNYQGPFAMVSDRLRDYGIDILEKDVSGKWAMQAMQIQMQQQGARMPPEATDEQMKDAVWIVLVTPQNPQEIMTNPSAGMLGPKLNEHLKNGGSALVLLYPQTEKMDFLKEWGIEPKPEYVLVHDKIDAQGARSSDRTMDWQRQQPVFGIDNYGDHLITRPLRSLDGIFSPLIPINTVEAKGVKVTRILPIPTTPRAWGEGDFDALRQRKTVDFNPNKTDTSPGDLPPPLWAGAVAESDKGGRLVVIGSLDFANNDFLQEPDMEVLNTQSRLVPRYPGNGELFVNSVFWLTKMDTMIAISPTALEVARVAPGNEHWMDFWRFGVLIIGLPFLVLAAGTFVYLKRRD